MYGGKTEVVMIDACVFVFAFLLPIFLFSFFLWCFFVFFFGGFLVGMFSFWQKNAIARRLSFFLVMGLIIK